MGPLALRSQRRYESRKAASSVMGVSQDQECIKAVMNKERHGAKVQGLKKKKKELRQSK